jgi:3-oxoacyl-[acyl-carrier-protein] synthase-3
VDERSGVGIRQTAVVLGEETWTPSRLANAVGAREEVVRRWVGDLTVHSSGRRPAELAADAGRLCLVRAGIDVRDVQAIVVGSSVPHELSEEGRRELHVQELLGARDSIVSEVGLACSESIVAFRVAKSLICDQPGVDRVLVAFGERRHARILGYDKETYQPVFSDLGAAALIERGARLTILGFGEATDGRHWNFLSEMRRSVAAAPSTPVAATPRTTVDPERLRLMADSVAVNRLALERCLNATGIRKQDIRHVLFSREGPRIPHAMMRQLDLPAELLYAPPHGPSHAGMADFVVSLDDMMEHGALEAGVTVLLGSRAVGSTRFCMVRA